jgi:glutamate 5-kinase
VSPDPARTTVVKVGSSSLTRPAGGLDQARLAALVAALAGVRAAGERVVLVSSGAIAAGLPALRLTRRPRDLATLQACASVGQLLLAQAYARAFAEYDIVVGQVLLTAEDVARRAHYRNARTTLARLLEIGVLPVVNENDTVATEEIRFGDNDRLAAHVAHLVAADRLLLLSDVDALYDASPARGGARRIPEVRTAEDLDGVTVHGSGALGSGGMASKLAAARMATSAGIEVVLGAAERADGLLAADPAAGGTRFPPDGERVSSRLLWLAHASAPRGRLRLDAGAVQAVLARRASLLPAGVTAVEGEFAVGEPVDLLDPDGRPVARGLAGYAAADLPPLLGRSTRDSGAREVVHRDDLIPLAPE